MALKLVEQSDNHRGRKGLHTRHYLNTIECCPRHVFHSRRNDETAPPCPRCGCSHDNLPRHKREACALSSGIFVSYADVEEFNAQYYGELR